MFIFPDGAAGDSPGQPCIHVVSLRGGGHVILSFVDLLPCAEMLGDVSTLATLKADAEVRRRFLRQLLERQLGLECDPEEERPVLSHTYLVCSDEVYSCTPYHNGGFFFLLLVILPKMVS